MTTQKMFVITDKETELSGVISNVDENTVSITWEKDETGVEEVQELTNDELAEMIDSDLFNVEEVEIELNEETVNEVDAPTRKDSPTAAAATIKAHSSADAQNGDNPKSRLDWIKAVVGNLAQTDNETLVKIFNDQQSMIGGEAERAGIAGNAEGNQNSINMKPSAAEGSAHVSPGVNSMPDKNPSGLPIGEDELKAIFGDELTEEFKTKVTTLFEAAVTARVIDEVSAIVEASEKKYEEAIKTVTEALVTVVETYIEKVAEEWISENEVAIESTLRTELTNDFLEDLKEVFVKNYIEISDEKVEVYEELVAAHEKANADLNTALNAGIAQDKTINELKRTIALSEATAGLTLPQKEKFQKLTAEVVFENEADFANKIKLIKEGFLSEKSEKPIASNILTEGVAPEITDEKPVDPSMAVISDVISRLTK